MHPAPTRPRPTTLVLSTILLLLGLPRLAVAAPGPFWQAFAGSWGSEASYVDSHFQPIVARYATLTRIELDGDSVVITEWKFYPDSPLARGMSGGKLPAGKGLETVTRSVGRPSAADSQLLDFGAERGRWISAGADLASGVIPGVGDAPRYRFVAALSGTRHATIATYGYADDGAFKGLALFRMERLASGDEAARLESLRREFAVGLVMDSRAPAAATR